MDLVLVGLPGSGKSAAGRRLARRHGAAFVDLDEIVERDAGKPVPAIFAEEGEAELPPPRARGSDYRWVRRTGTRNCAVSSAPAAERSWTRATAGCCIAAASPSGWTARRRSSASAWAAAPTSGR